MSIPGESHILNLHKQNPTTMNRKSFQIKHLSLTSQAQKSPTKLSRLAAQVQGQDAWMLMAHTHSRGTPGYMPTMPALPAQTCPQGDHPTQPISTERRKLPLHDQRPELQRTFTDQTKPSGQHLEYAACGAPGAQMQEATTMPYSWQGLLCSISVPALPWVNVSSME